MNRDTLLSGVLIVLLIAAGVWFYLNFERVTERELVGYHGEALHNPFLAAQRLLERMGMATRKLQHPAELEKLPPGAALLLPRNRSGLSAQALTALLRWVDEGGHLIVAAEYYKNKDPLLDRLNIERIEIRNRAERGPSAVTLPHAPQTMRVHFGYWQKLLPREQPAYRFDDISGTHVVHLTRGRGAVTVLPDFQFMTNPAIAKNDHAEFVWQLVQFVPQPREVLVAGRIEMPTLLDWLLEHALAALALAAVLLVSWLWRIVPRFGPLKPDAPPGRRRLLDHLRASGRFHWKRGGAERLLEVARETCLRNIARSHPGVVDLPRAECVERLSAMTQLSARQIDLALHGSADEPMRFTGAVRALQQIEERLVRKIKN